MFCLHQLWQRGAKVPVPDLVGSYRRRGRGTVVEAVAGLHPPSPCTRRQLIGALRPGPSSFSPPSPSLVTSMTMSWPSDLMATSSSALPPPSPPPTARTSRATPRCLSPAWRHAFCQGTSGSTPGACRGAEAGASTVTAGWGA